MKYLVLLVSLILVSCGNIEKSCEDNPHQVKCPGHGNHGHGE